MRSSNRRLPKWVHPVSIPWAYGVKCQSCGMEILFGKAAYVLDAFGGRVYYHPACAKIEFARSSFPEVSA